MVDTLPSPFDPDRMRLASNGSGTFGEIPPPAGGYVPPKSLTLEYISGEYGPYQGAYYRSLPRWIDDISRDFPDVYEQMLLDDQVSACTRTIVESVLADDLTLRPAVDDKEDPDYDTAKTVLEFCERSLGNLPRSIEDWLREMLAAVALGNRVSEQVYRVEESGLDAGRLVLDRLKVKPRKHTGFVIDVYANLVGILGWVPGMPNWSGTVALGDLATVPNLLPRDKFAILVHSPQDEDPRGTSILRAAYRSWWQKLQCMADWLKHLGQFGSPSLLGICAPDAITQPAADSQGNPILGGIALSPAQQMVNELLRFRNGYALAVPNGADVRLLQSAASKGAFTEAIDYHDRAIARAILLASRVTMEAEHGSKADSETAQDVTGAAIKRRKSWAAWMVTHDVLAPLVRYNFGADIANRLCPRATLTAVEHQDWTQNASAVAQLASVGFLQKQQWPALYEKLGLPPADAPPEEGAQAPAPAAAEGEQPAEPAQPAAGFANLPQPYQEGKHPRGYHGKWATKGALKEKQKQEKPQPPQWDGRIDQDAVESGRVRGYTVAQWSTYGDAGEEYPGHVLLREGTYDPFPDDPSFEPVDVFRWEARDGDSGHLIDAGEWTDDADEATADGEQYAREADEEPPEEEEELEEDEEEEPEEEEDENDWDQAGTREQAEEVFADLGDKDILALLGFAAGSTLTGRSAVRKWKGHYSDDVFLKAYGIEVEVHHPKLKECRRFLGVDVDGAQFVKNDVLKVKPEYRAEGLGADIFAAQVAEMSRKGYTYIQCHAAGDWESAQDPDEGMNGYYTWPRFGYDMDLAHIRELDSGLAHKIEYAFPQADSILDVMATKEGRDWWLKEGSDLYDARFDLTPGSRSREVLDAYLLERAAKGRSKSAR